MSAPRPSTATLPPERLYWAVLEAPGVHEGCLPSALLPEVQDDTPVPVEELHAVAAPTGDGRLVVCAAPRSELAAADPQLTSLHPESVPASLNARVQPQRLNLLVGECEPVPVRRARRRRHLAGLAAVIIGAAVAAHGMMRRADHWSAVAQDARSAGDRVLNEVSSRAGPEGLVAEIARLKSLNDAAASLHAPPDGAARLTEVLKSWPTRVSSRPQSISVAPGAVSVSVSIDGDAAPFLEAFQAPPGWTLDQPRLTTAGAISRVALQLCPTAEGKP